MKTSETIGKIADALAKAQATADKLAKTSTAQAGQYSYTYATLADSIAAVREAFSANGIAIVQGAGLVDGVVEVTTTLAHSSGEWMSSVMSMPTGRKPQEVGSAITYARRYALQAMCGIAPDDDDGAAAQRAEPPPPKAKPSPFQENAKIEADKYKAATGVTSQSIAAQAGIPVRPTTEEHWKKLLAWLQRANANALEPCDGCHSKNGAHADGCPNNEGE